MGLITNLINEVLGTNSDSKQQAQSYYGVDNPATPFFFPIINGLPSGADLVVQGTALNGPGKGFSVNYLGSGEDVALHINPRFKFLEHQVVLNTYSWGKWQKEDRHSHKLSLGDQFRIRVLNRGQDFMIELNDHQVGIFKHRIDPRHIRGVEVKGEVSVQGVRFYNFQDHINAPNQSTPTPSSFSAPSISAPSIPSAQPWPQQPATAPNSYAPNSTTASNVSGGYFPSGGPSAVPYPTSTSSGSGYEFGSTGGGGVYPSLNNSSHGYSSFPGAPQSSGNGCLECAGIGRPYGCPVCHKFN